MSTPAQTAVPSHSASPADQLHEALAISNVPVTAADRAKIAYYRDFNRFAQLMANASAAHENLSITPERAAHFRKIAEENTDPRVLLERLTEATWEVFALPCQEAFFSLEEQCGSEGSSDFFPRVKEVGFRRWSILRSDARADMERQVVDPLQRPFFSVLSMVNFGINNAAHSSWSLFEVIPRVWTTGCAEPLQESRYERIARSSLGVLGELTSGEDDAFHGLLHLLRGSDGLKVPWAPYQAERLEIVDDTIRIKAETYLDAVELASEIIAISDHIEDESVRAGCPSWPLIKVIHTWCVEMFVEAGLKTAWCPAFPKLTS